MTLTWRKRKQNDFCALRKRRQQKKWQETKAVSPFSTDISIGPNMTDGVLAWLQIHTHQSECKHQCLPLRCVNIMQHTRKINLDSFSGWLSALGCCTEIVKRNRFNIWTFHILKGSRLFFFQFNFLRFFGYMESNFLNKRHI